MILSSKIVLCKEITSDDIIQALTFLIFTVMTYIPLKGRRVECTDLLSHEIFSGLLTLILNRHLTKYYSYNSLTLFLTTEISLQIFDKSLLLWIYGIIRSKFTSNSASPVNHIRTNIFKLLPSTTD